jgi:hypothetical protein
MTRTNLKSKYTCRLHPDRPGVVDKGNGNYPCWECYLGREAFVERFGKDFYTKAGEK